MDQVCVMGQGDSIPGDSVGVDTPWWSFSKTLIALAALRTVEMGGLALDEALPSEPYTLRQLLQHRAGLTDYGGSSAYHQAVARGDDPWSVDELLERTDAERLIYPPGEGWAYSNIGYLRVRRLIEAATGQPLAAALRDLVFEPLGARRARLVESRDDLGGVPMGSAEGYHPGWVYHGLAVGPVGEAASVLMRLMSGDLISPRMLAEMRRGYPLPQYANGLWAKPAYGLGLMAPVTRTGLRVSGHTGEGPGSNIAVYAVDAIDGPVAAAAWSTEEPSSTVEAIAVGMLEVRARASRSSP